MSNGPVKDCATCVFFRRDRLLELDGRTWEQGTCGSLIPPANPRTIFGPGIRVEIASFPAPRVSSGMICELHEAAA